MKKVLVLHVFRTKMSIFEKTLVFNQYGVKCVKNDFAGIQ